jgi:hypothetical protein
MKEKGEVRMTIQKSKSVVSVGISIAICLLFFMACSDGNGMKLPTMTKATEISTQTTAISSTGSTTDWVFNPPEIPSGLIGTSNCTASFFADGTQFTLHPDSGCWEKSGSDMLVRQQLNVVHIPSLSLCRKGPGDVTSIRLCAGPGVEGVETVCGPTGPRGCATCPGEEIVCH